MALQRRNCQKKKKLKIKHIDKRDIKAALFLANIIIAVFAAYALTFVFASVVNQKMIDGSLKGSTMVLFFVLIFIVLGDFFYIIRFLTKRGVKENDR